MPNRLKIRHIIAFSPSSIHNSPRPAREVKGSRTSRVRITPIKDRRDKTLKGSMSQTSSIPAASQAVLNAMRGAEQELIDRLCEANGMGAGVTDEVYRRQDLVQFFAGLLSMLRARLEQPPEIAAEIEDDFFEAVVQGVLQQGTSYRDIVAGSNVTYMTLAIALLDRTAPEQRAEAKKLLTGLTSGWFGRVTDAIIAHAKNAP
jgi:hypothetical protein